MKITSITTTPLMAPLKRPLRTASGHIERFPVVLIELHTDAGVTGRTYTQCYFPEMLQALEQAVIGLARMVIGQPLVPRDLHELVRRRCRLFGMKGLQGMALGSLDMAWWDAWARARNEPLARALGAEARPLRAYYSVGMYDAASVAVAAEEARAGGYAGLKIKIGFADFADDLASVRAARRALGDGMALMADYNQSLSVPEAVRRCRALDDEGLEWIEEPVLADDLTGCAQVALAARTPIQIGENFHGPDEMRNAIAVRAMDLVMPDVQFVQGVTGWLEAAALARAAGVPMSSHIFTEASAQLLCATPTAHWLEVLDVMETLRVEPLTVRDGCVHPSLGAGLGLEWKADAVERCRV